MKFTYLFLLIGLLSISLLRSQKNIASAKIDFEFVSKKVNGTISGFQSTSTIDSDNLSNSIFKGSVAVQTLKTGNFLRDWSLKSGKYFDQNTYPRIYFESTEVIMQDDVLKVIGKLTIKSTVRSVTVAFVKKGEQLIGTTTINSSDFGITVIKKRKEDNKVTVQMVFSLK